ncbi:MAG: hypothetical protein JEZ09_15310 [Salinivirgaceae bacterium]|nr:hypothetical protein [Salinivirgaceae bacterium]
MVVFAINKLKQLKNRISDTAHSIKNIKSTTQNHISNSKKLIKDKEGQMTEDQKEDVNKLFDVLDNI